MSTAHLGFAIDSSQAAGAAADLDKLTSSAAKVEQAAGRTGAAGTRMSQAFSGVTPALDKIVASLGRLEASSTQIDRKLTALARAAANAAKGNGQLEQSAIEASSAYKQLEASLNAVQSAQRKGEISLQRSQAMIDKQREAIAKLNAEIKKLNSTPVHPDTLPPANNNRPNGGQSGVGNVAAQLFDIGTTAAFMNPATVAIQQGPQLAQAFAGQSTKQALTGLGAGLAAIVSPLSLAAIGLTGVTAAAIQFGVGLIGAADSSKKLDDALERHDDILKRLEDRYGVLIERAKGYSVESSKILQFEAGADVRALRNATKLQGQDFLDATGGNIFARSGRSGFRVNSTYSAFSEEITRLREEMKNGRPDFEAFYDSIYRTAQTDPGYAKKADELAKLVEGYRSGTRAIEDMERAQRNLFNSIGPNGMLLSQGTMARESMGDYELYRSQQDVAARRRRESFDASVFGLNARSPQQRAEAARRAEASRYDNSESASDRRQRIEQAGAMALAQAEHQLAEAQRDRLRNLDRQVDSQRQELEYIGKTSTEVAGLRLAYEQIANVRAEAARNGIEADEAEIARIREKADEYGELAKKIAEARFAFDLRQRAADARLSERDRQIVEMQRQYGLPEGAGNASGQQIGNQLAWEENKKIADSFFTSVHDKAWQNGGKIGEAIVSAAQQAAMNLSKKMWENIFDQFSTIIADWLTPKTQGAAAAGQSVAGKVLGAANDNIFPGAPVGAVTRASLPAVGDMGSYRSAISAIESGGNYGALGPITRNGDRAYGKYQMMGNNIGPWSRDALGRSISTDEFLANPGLQDQIFDHRFGGYVNKYGASGAAQAWFGGPGSVGRGGAATDILGTSGNEYVRKFETNVSKMGDVAGQTTQGLGGLNNGLNAITQNFGGGAGLGSGSSWLSLITGAGFGGSGQLLRSGGIGLFANGTDSAPGGLSIVGERGPELLNLPQGSGVLSNHKLMEKLSANQNEPVMLPAKYEIHVHGGSGDEHIRGLVSSGIQQADLQRNDSMRRGGFGQIQRRFGNQKG